MAIPFSTETTPTLNDFSGQIQGAINAAVRKAVEEAVRTRPPPSVNVAPPNINVAAPNVTVDAPKITVPVEVTPADVIVPGMDRLQAEIAGLRQDMMACMNMMMKPIVRTVTRDAEGRILTIIDRRG